MPAAVAPVALAPAVGVMHRRPRGSLLWRLMAHERGALGGAVCLVVVLAALFAPAIAPHDRNAQDLSAALRPPFWMEGGSFAHLLGTDPLGRDVLSRVIFGARVSLAVAGAGVLVAGTLGVALGLVAGYFRGPLEAVLMRLADVQLSFPYILLDIAVMAVLKSSLWNLVVVLSLRSWVVYACVVRGQVLAIRQRDFVQCAISLGASAGRVLRLHVAPNTLGPVIVITSFQLAELIVAESSLSFLDLGVQPPVGVAC